MSLRTLSLNTKLRTILLLGCALILGTILTTLYTKESSKTGISPETMNNVESAQNPLDAQQAHGYVLPQTPAQRTLQAHSIIVGTIETVSQVQWNTPDGHAPKSMQEETRQGKIPYAFRTVTLSVVRYLKNPQPEFTITIQQLEGLAEGMDVTSDLVPGRRVVLFLSKKQQTAVKWGYYTMYIIEGDTATSKFDRQALPVTELISNIEQHAK
jgi:hypothetical protein